MQGRCKGPSYGACSYQEAVDACASGGFRLEAIGFSALSGVVSYAAVERGDEQYGEAKQVRQEEQ